MKIKLTGSLIILIFISCSRGHHAVNSECNQDKAIQTVNKRYKRSGHKLENYVIETSEDSLYYVVEYKLKEPARYGGGRSLQFLNRTVVL